MPAGSVPRALQGHVAGDVVAHLQQAGEVFASFLLQDSSCQSYGVAVAGARWFVKVPVEQRAVPSLQRAIAIHGAVRHPTVIPLAGTFNTELGPALVYPWVDGQVLYGAPIGGRPARLDPTGPHARFRALPLAEVLAAVDALFDAHLAITAAGFVAVDLYDGCFVYDFDARRLWLCDLDEYRPGPFTVDADRLPGSTRFMAPEEWARGPLIDERTTVFNLGRAAQVLMDEGDLDGRFRGSLAAARLLEAATNPEPSLRPGSVHELVSKWRCAHPSSSGNGLSVKPGG